MNKKITQQEEDEFISLSRNHVIQSSLKKIESIGQSYIDKYVNAHKDSLINLRLYQITCRASLQIDSDGEVTYKLTLIYNLEFPELNRRIEDYVQSNVINDFGWEVICYTEYGY